MLRKTALVLSAILGVAGASLSLTSAQAEHGPDERLDAPIYHPGRIDPGRPRGDHGYGYRGHWRAAPPPRVVPHYDPGQVYIQPRRPPPPRRIAPHYGYYPPHAAPGWERPRFHAPGWYN